MVSRSPEQFDVHAALRDSKFRAELARQPDGQSLMEGALYNDATARELQYRYEKFKEFAATKKALLELFEHLMETYSADAHLDLEVDAEMERILEQAIRDREANGDPIELERLRLLCQGAATLKKEQAEFDMAKQALDQHGAGAKKALFTKADKQNADKSWWSRRKIKKGLAAKLDTVKREQELENYPKDMVERNWDQVNKKQTALAEVRATIRTIKETEDQMGNLESAIAKLEQAFGKLESARKQLEAKRQELEAIKQKLEDEERRLQAEASRLSAEAFDLESRNRSTNTVIMMRVPTAPAVPGEDVSELIVKNKKARDNSQDQLTKNQTAQTRNGELLAQNQTKRDENRQAIEKNRRETLTKRQELSDTEDDLRYQTRGRDKELAALDQQHGVAADRVEAEYVRLSDVLLWQRKEQGKIAKVREPLNRVKVALLEEADRTIQHFDKIQTAVARRIEHLASRNPLQAGKDYDTAQAAERSARRPYLDEVQVGRDEIEDRAREQVKQDATRRLLPVATSGAELTAEALEDFIDQIKRENKLKSPEATNEAIVTALREADAQLQEYMRALRDAENEIVREQQTARAQLRGLHHGPGGHGHNHYPPPALKWSAVRSAASGRWREVLSRNNPADLSRALIASIKPLIDEHAWFANQDSTLVPETVRVERRAAVAEMLARASQEQQKGIADRLQVLRLVIEETANPEYLTAEERAGLDAVLAKRLTAPRYPRVTVDRTRRSSTPDPKK